MRQILHTESITVHVLPCVALLCVAFRESLCFALCCHASTTLPDVLLHVATTLTSSVLSDGVALCCVVLECVLLSAVSTLMILCAC